MKLPFGLRSLTEKKELEFTCKVCSMKFQYRESLDRHRNKANHFGAINL